MSVQIKTPSVKDKLYQLTTASMSLQQIILKKGFISEDNDPDGGEPEQHRRSAPIAGEKSNKVNDDWRRSVVKMVNAGLTQIRSHVELRDSVTTIYKNAVQCVQVNEGEQPASRRNSSSDEEMIDTSDETIEM